MPPPDPPDYLQRELEDDGYWESLGAHPQPAPLGPVDNPEQVREECWRIGELPVEDWPGEADRHASAALMLEAGQDATALGHRLVAYAVRRYFSRTGTSHDPYLAATDEYYDAVLRDVETALTEEQWREAKALSFTFDLVVESREPSWDPSSDVGETGSGGWGDEGPGSVWSEVESTMLWHLQSDDGYEGDLT